MKINKLIEKYFFFQFVYIFPFGIIFHLVILDNFSLIEAILYSFVLAAISTYFLNLKIKDILKYKIDTKKYEVENFESNVDITTLNSQLDRKSFWSNNLLQVTENQLLIVSNISILAYQELILINYKKPEDNKYEIEIIIDKSKSSLATSKKDSLKKEILSKL